MNDVAVECYKPSDAEPFMNERQREYFRRKLIAWRDAILAESRDTLAALQQESENHFRLRRPRVLGDRPGDRAARSRSAAQTDRQNRVCVGAHRRRLLRLLRRDGRSHLAQAARRASDRDPFGRGAGTPRTARAYTATSSPSKDGRLSTSDAAHFPASPARARARDEDQSPFTSIFLTGFCASGFFGEVTVSTLS